MQPPAEHVHWLFATGALLLGLLLLAEAIVGQEVWRLRAWRAYLWPSLFFALTSAIYLVQADAEGVESGRWPLLSPWLHSSALPVFAVLAVLCALVWGAVRDWLADYEQYAQESVARALRLVWQRTVQVLRPSRELAIPPRRLFGLAFESRPPPPLPG